MKTRTQFRKSTRKNATQAANEIGRAASRRGQFRAARVSRFCAWICEIAREFSSECCNNLSNNHIFPNYSQNYAKIGLNKGPAKTGLAPREARRPVLLMRTFVESNFGVIWGIILEKGVDFRGKSARQPCSQADIVAKLTIISRGPRKLYHDLSPSTWGRAKRAPCTQAVIVVNFAWAREINANFATMSAWLHGCRALLPQKSIAVNFTWMRFFKFSRKS